MRINSSLLPTEYVAAWATVSISTNHLRSRFSAIFLNQLNICEENSRYYYSQRLAAEAIFVMEITAKQSG